MYCGYEEDNDNEAGSNRMELETRLSRLQNLVRGIKSELQFEKSLLQREKQTNGTRFADCTTHDRRMITCSDRSFDTPTLKSNFSTRRPLPTISVFSEGNSNFSMLTRPERCIRHLAKDDNGDDDDGAVRYHHQELGIDLADFYKRKISDLEADCCAGLNKIRSRFTTQSSLDSQTSSEGRSLADDSGMMAMPMSRGLGFGDVGGDHRRGFEPKCTNDGVETLWSAMGDPFSEADFTALMNEANCANECLISSEQYPELTLPPESARTTFAY